MNKFKRRLDRTRTAAEFEDLVEKAIGPSGLMEFARFDAGAVLRKVHGGQSPRMLRLLIGNPVIMRAMAETVPDAAAYAPVTILVDERDDGVHLSYDSMVSLVASYGSPTALAVAEDLDAKLDTLFNMATSAREEGGDAGKKADPISETGSLAAADALLMGGLLNDW